MMIFGVLCMMPSVTELTYFCEIANIQNISHAAKNLSISQPSLTRAIQNLEAKMGVDLFIRHKKGVVLTPSGKKLLLQVKPLLACWQNTQFEVRACHHEVEGRIKIGCHSTTGLFIHGFLGELLRNYPKVEVDIHSAASETLTQKVVDLEIDIGIVSNPIAYPDLISRKISDTETTLWISKKYMHSDEAVIICNPDILHTQFILQKLKSEKIKFSRIVRVDTIEVIASLAAHGCGAGIIPSSFVKGLYADKLIRVKNAPVFNDDLYLIYRKEYKEIALFKTVIANIKKWADIVNAS